MLRTRLLLVLLVLTACGTCLAQQRLSRATPARLRIVVTFDDGQTRVRDAMVEVQDAVGGSSVTDQQLTDQDGRVEFSSYTGTHRIRITGSNILPYEGEFDITPAENYHQENIRVRRKTGDQASSPEGQGTIPTIRLKIPDKAREEFEKGSEALKQQQWEAGRKHFQAAIDLYPDYDMAYNGLGSAAWQLRDLAGARAAFLKATQLNEQFAEAQRNLSRILLGERNYVELANHLNLSLKVEPTNTWALSYAAFAELQLRRFQEALDHARRVHGLPHEKLTWVHMVAGYALENLGRKQEAAAEFKLYLKEDPKGSDVKHAQEALARLATPPRS
jgi:tetratricopeptide (TPR) repeat protein